MDLKSICVYCGSSSGTDPAVEVEIRSFAREIARRGIRLVYGGAARGLMGALADEGRETPHSRLTELKVVETMHEREQLLFDLADAFVAFPGGFGTMEELIEMITWKQMGIHGKPIVIANIGGYFDSLLRQFELAVGHGFARREDRILFTVAEHTKSILTFLEGAPVMARKAGDWA
jgi:predicted Rossmann-fold nucleotide-binding protein